MNNQVKNQDLWQFCAFYRQQFGPVHDATIFRNELGLRFYHQTQNVQELFERCVKQRYLRCHEGNVRIKVSVK